MEQIKVNELKNGDRFSGCLLVRTADKRTGIKGAAYLDLNLADRAGEINAKVWDGNRPLPEVGSVVDITGAIQEYNGRLQLRVEGMKPVTPTDEQWEMLIPCAPESTEKMLNDVRTAAGKIKSDPLRRITEEMLNRYEDKLLYYPAAQRIHHAERGGLLHHTTGMLKMAARVQVVYNFLNSDLLCAGVIIHDLCKIDEMDSDDKGIVKDYSAEGLLLGHITMGVSKVREVAHDLGISGEPVLLLEHMLLSHHEKPEWGSPRLPMFPEAEALHWLDILDARMNEMKGVEDKLNPGTFSERINSLERRVYHPKYDDLLDEKTVPPANTDGLF